MEQIISTLIGLHKNARNTRSFALHYYNHLSKANHYAYMASGIIKCMYYLGYKPILGIDGHIEETVKFMMEPDYKGLYEYWQRMIFNVSISIKSDLKESLDVESGLLSGIIEVVKVVGEDKFDEYRMHTTKSTESESAEDCDLGIEGLFEDEDDDEHIITVVEE